MIKDKKSLKATTPARRKFFKAAAVTGAAAATAVAMPNIATADGHVTLKMQAAWPSGANIFFKPTKRLCWHRHMEETCVIKSYTFYCLFI